MTQSSSENQKRNLVLEQAWNEAAEGYDAYFSERFAPWIHAALETLRSTLLPPGPILVPCCGPGREVRALAAEYPERRIVGLDLSEGMLAVAAQHCNGLHNVELLQRDVSDPAAFGMRAAGVVSAFGLQQLADPRAALHSWARALHPSGSLSAVFWPSKTEASGPFAILRELLDARVPRAPTSWENELTEAITSAGASVIHDITLAFPMHHANATTLWNAMVESGSLRSTLLSRGSKFMREIREEFVARLPDGPIAHRPHARLLTARQS